MFECPEECSGTLVGSDHFSQYILHCDAHGNVPTEEDVDFILSAFIKAVEARGLSTIGSVHPSGNGDDVACTWCDRDKD